MTDTSMDKPTGVRVEARVVPFPRSISAEARAALAKFVKPDSTLRPLLSNPAPDDKAGWATVRAENEKMMMGMMADRFAHLTAGVETVEIAGVTVHVGTPATLPADTSKRAYIDIHGGALVFGNGVPCRAGAQVAAQRHGVTVYAVDYRMPPEHPYPAALDDCLAVYQAVLEHHAAADVIIGGASAGGNLAAALMLRARDKGLPLPAAVVLITPELDLTESGDSFEVNRTVDVVLQGSLADSNALYAAGCNLADPYLSPLFGDFTRGFPATFLQAGTRDLFLSNAVRMHRALRKANVPVELHIFEGMPHGGFQGAPEDAELAAEVDRFVAAHWGCKTAS
ncbi:alpha/beta hydrolase [Nostoc sp.]|uniref:alpha/beta hydrolase n=1 Tax=Nostoc sp. TaxID=1180 RepID=UPI002FF8FD6C